MDFMLNNIGCCGEKGEAKPFRILKIEMDAKTKPPDITLIINVEVW